MQRRGWKGHCIVTLSSSSCLRRVSAGLLWEEVHMEIASPSLLLACLPLQLSNKLKSLTRLLFSLLYKESEGLTISLYPPPSSPQTPVPLPVILLGLPDLAGFPVKLQIQMSNEYFFLVSHAMFRTYLY